ncbi:hypothetical protein D3C79_595980 [compost metagenome]
MTAGINTTINGSHFADAFKASLLSNIQGEVGKSTADWIGDQGIKFDAANSPLAEAGKIAAHGITSGAIAEITGGKFASGAAGGAMSELASNWSMQVFGNPEHQVALNKMLGGLAAVAVTGDQNQFDTGADRAETIYRYNNLQHLRLQFSAESQMEQIERDMAPIIQRANEEAAKETIKSGALILGTAYLGPLASVGSIATGSTISVLANGTYQWYDLSQPGNENKPWDYWASTSAALTGALSPGRGIWENTSIAIGATLITDGVDGGALSGTTIGSLAGGAVGKYVPVGMGKIPFKMPVKIEVPGVIYDYFGGVTSEFSAGYVKSISHELDEKEKKVNQ